jgi:hypothetical protein
MILLALMLFAQDTSGFVGEIQERLGKPVSVSFETLKPVIDLELCIANALSSLGTPTMLREGPDKVHMMISFPAANAYLASASFITTQTGTRIDLRVRGKGWDDRLTSRVKDCL